MNTPEITVKRREGTGKGVARRLRRAGAVPAILYAAPRRRPSPSTRAMCSHHPRPRGHHAAALAEVEAMAARGWPSSATCSSIP